MLKIVPKIINKPKIKTEHNNKIYNTLSKKNPEYQDTYSFNNGVMHNINKTNVTIKVALTLLGIFGLSNVQGCTKTTPHQPVSRTSTKKTIKNSNDVLLNTLKKNDKQYNYHMGNLKKSLNMNEKQVVEYLNKLCTHEKWGNNKISPITLYGLICVESKGKANAVSGDGKAIGLGQMREIAVKQVNLEIKNKKYGDFTYNKYTSANRYNAKKSLEMTVLYLRYCIKRTGSQNAGLAMYNCGNTNGINKKAGMRYVRKVNKYRR